ncbi:MAG: relaxase/mobilization nuclease domain-containing protein [Clostridia bacterium]|nr:relaxase/mobilization nuclease domain-containing protein [Clostridia bacterium]
MATTSLWKVENRLDKVIKYTTNIDKTKNENYETNFYRDLHNTIEYAKADFKTEEQVFVTGINCNKDTAFKDMIQTKKHFGKEKGILAYHGFQSFAEGEVTPEQAHEIGVKLAEELWGDKYEVVVSTHVNTNHIHNHFVLNSVSFVNGRKYVNNREHYALMRRTSDDLCREYNLSVIEEKPCGKHNIDYTKYYSSYIHKTDYYTTTKEDVDFAIKQAYSYKNFETILKQMGYTVTIRANKISLCRPPYKRNIRIERSFGIEYSIRNIEERILNSEMIRVPFPEEYRKIKRYTGRIYNNIKIDRGSLYRLYLYYCYKLKVFPKNKNNRVKMTPELRQEIKKMDEISDEIKFLCRNKIKTTEELFSYKKLVTDELNKQLKSRNSLRRKRQKENDTEERQKLCEEILVLSDKINYLKQEVGYCEKIEEQNKIIKSNLKEMQENERQKENEKIKKKGELEK